MGTGCVTWSQVQLGEPIRIERLYRRKSNTSQTSTHVSWPGLAPATYDFRRCQHRSRGWPASAGHDTDEPASALAGITPFAFHQQSVCDHRRSITKPARHPVMNGNLCLRIACAMQGGSKLWA